jgi:hypothetical protein
MLINPGAWLLSANTSMHPAHNHTCVLQVVLEVLLSAAAAGRRFHVIVLDSRPELEGRQMLRRLLQVWGASSSPICRQTVVTSPSTHLLPQLCLRCVVEAALYFRSATSSNYVLWLLIAACQADIPCSYVLLSGLSYIMREVSKVRGAAAISGGCGSAVTLRQSCTCVRVSHLQFGCLWFASALLQA